MMSWLKPQEEILSETEYIPSEDEEDINERILKVHKKLEHIYKEETSLMKELRQLEDLRLKRRKFQN
jgi:flagellar biosynthesis/type III secretory pathway chaperone